MRKIGKKIHELRYLLIILSVCACYAGILYNQTMPFAEGWYSYYAKCINRGEVVYKDFDYLFTPLYIFFIALITKIFGYKVIILRIVGIIFFCLIGTFVYLSLKELFNEEIAVIATITSVMYMQSEVVQVFYDYVRMMDIFSCAATYFLIKAIKNDDRKKYFILAGIATSLFILTKQNMGLLFWIYSIILICSVSLVLRRSVKEKLIYFITGSIVPIFITIIFMLINGSLIPFFNQTGGEAVAAKGGILPILFNWIINNMSSFINTSKFSIICLACIIVSAIIKKKDEKTGEETEVEDYDWDAITKKVKSFIDDYNDVVKEAGESNTKDVLRNASWMTGMTDKTSHLLSKIGITIGKGNKLELDEDELKKADISSLKTVFTGYNSFAGKTAQKAAGILNAANRASATYTNNGTYSKRDSSLTSSKIDKEV